MALESRPYLKEPGVGKLCSDLRDFLHLLQLMVSGFKSADSLKRLQDALLGRTQLKANKKRTTNVYTAHSSQQIQNALLTSTQLTAHSKYKTHY